ncbi:Bestrophin, RFP-TM, chloride channel-domain-containing protein [Cyathus striatus]|nr:Bestrophin, RFP-TM, chloride channel-domain-containing protein [Cyathus striatus]
MTSHTYEPHGYEHGNHPAFDENTKYDYDLPSPVSAEVHKGFLGNEPFAARQRKKRTLIDSIISTAFFKCWHLMTFFLLWATIIVVVNKSGKKMQMPDTLLKLNHSVGTVLGFVTSTRTTTSFARYNEGRNLWSKLIYNSRTLSRIIWFNIPDRTDDDGNTTPELKARDLIEKKTILNLVLAHAVSLKHYLRHEDGIYYKDLYYLVKFLPAYVEHQSMGTPTAQDGDKVFRDMNVPINPFLDPNRNEPSEDRSWHTDESNNHHNPYNVPLPRSPLPPRSAVAPRSPFYSSSRPGTPKMSTRRRLMSRMGFHRSRHAGAPAKAAILSKQDEAFLLPAKKPPKYHLFDLFPFSLLVKFLSQKYKDRQSKRARMKELLRRKRVNHNLPLEISLYIGSYVTMIQKRKMADNLTMNVMNQSLNNMVDAATNLERIATTPLPFIYSIHMWLITLIYCFLLPLQIYKTMKVLTIPSTGLMAFFYFGFLVAGEELEDPFGYDKNDLDLDHFTNNIMRNELMSITSAPPPDPTRWMFVPENNVLFSTNLDERFTPNEWTNMRAKRIQNSLRMMP